MTTPQAAARYLSEHYSATAGRGYAVYNPHNRPVEELPTIYGFNNGGGSGMYDARLIAEDGTWLGGHCCSDEGYMRHDVAVLEGSRPDRHDQFRAHYPDGYKMDFVGYDDVPSCVGLMLALDHRKTLDNAADCVE